MPAPQSSTHDESQQTLEQEALVPLIDRMVEVFPDIDDLDQLSFWVVVGDFFRKQSPSWMKQYKPIHSAIRSLAEMFEDLLRRGKLHEEKAAEVFRALIEKDEISISTLLLRSQMFAHGSFGVKANLNHPSFLNPDEVESTAVALSKKYRVRHLTELWLARISHER